MEYKEIKDLSMVLRSVLMRGDISDKSLSTFKENVKKLYSETDDSQVESTQRGFLCSFLNNTYFQGQNLVVQEHHGIDLSILGGKDTNSKVRVIIELKSTSNKQEMPKENNLAYKGFYESIFYYMRERDKGDNEITFVIITNTKEWFIFDAHEYERLFWINKELQKKYKAFKNGQSSTYKTEQFYNETIAPFVESCTSAIRYIYFRLFDKTISRDGSVKNQVKGIYKLLSPNFLFKRYDLDDSNHLNYNFYQELLYIMGLEEVKVDNISVIRRKKPEDRQPGSLIENTILAIKKTNTSGLVSLENGDNEEEKYFDTALNLVITWINRILFLKLLEAQLVKYHNGDKKYAFLNIETIPTYDDLDDLFFLVLAKPFEERPDFIREKYPNLPYLNSALFETTREEVERAMISNLNDSYRLSLYPKSVLSSYVKKSKRSMGVLEYIFNFLNSYNFGSDSIKADEVGDYKPLISASVLGLIFEKINGYRDGSIFTPSKITMEMCSLTIRKNFIDRINQKENWNCSSIEEVYNKLTTPQLQNEANDIINATRICDPAVGSGHYLVSSLNELIALKSDLGILHDKDGKVLRDVNITIYNDELLVRDTDNTEINYKPSSLYAGSQRIQETIFSEKKSLIENCLFGADININSVNICRLRLWIELLKSSYYDRETGKLSTLPNIDINIKCGNSLNSKIPVIVGRKVKWANNLVDYSFKQYRELVKQYRQDDNKTNEIALEKQIDVIRRALSGSKQQNLFGREWVQDVDDPNNNTLEWMVEFPDLLDDEGVFKGFDIVIGNPPYIHLGSLGKKMSKFYKDMTLQLEAGGQRVHTYSTYDAKGDMYSLFFELGRRLVCEQGLVSFITSNNWMRAKYGERTRKFISENTNPLLLVDFNKVKVFDNATVEPNILIMQRATNLHACKSVIIDKQGYKDFHKNIRQNVLVLDFNEKPWYVQEPMSKAIRNQIYKVGVRLDDEIWGNKISRGVTTGNNDAFIVDETTRQQILDACSSEEERSITEKLLKKIIFGRDVQKYTCKWPGTYLIATFPSLDYDIADYPAVENYLKSFAKKELLEKGYENIANDDDLLHDFCYQKLQQAGKVISINGENVFLTPDPSKPERSRKKNSNKWFETQDNIAYYEDFNLPKIIWKRIGSDLRFAYDETGMLALDSACILSGPYSKFICGILNSALGHFMLSFSPSTGTGDLIVSVQAVEPIHVPLPSEEEKKEIEDIVDKLRVDDNADLEAELNNKVFELYGLDDREEQDYVLSNF